jgi:hypothetical protein
VPVPVPVQWRVRDEEWERRGKQAMPDDIRSRLAALDWGAVTRVLDADGHACIPGLLDPGECHALRACYRERDHFRSFVDLAQHRFGDHGDYRYFARPLPALVESLRIQLYARLWPVANRWWSQLGRNERFPRGLAPFLARCHERGQTRPTPLLLRYEAKGYNCLHQDLYGDIAFPLQVAILLSEPERDFSGGEFLLTEQRPRMQSRGRSIQLARGDALIFPNRMRPVATARGHAAAQVRHGTSPVHAGERYVLGIIFHDAS